MGRRKLVPTPPVDPEQAFIERMRRLVGDAQAKPSSNALERHAALLEAAAVQLRRIGTGATHAEEQSLLDTRAIIGVLTKASAVERWSRRLVGDALDRMADLEVAGPITRRNRR